MKEKVISVTIGGNVLVFNSWEEYCSHEYKLMAELFDNAFDMKDRK